MTPRNDYIHDLIIQLDEMITSIEDREVEESGFTDVRMMIEQVREELDALQEND